MYEAGNKRDQIAPISDVSYDAVVSEFFLGMYTNTRAHLFVSSYSA